MELTPSRVMDGLRWRAEALVERLPRGLRVWMDNHRRNALVRQGITSFERARLTQQRRRKLCFVASCEEKNAGEKDAATTGTV